MFALLVLTIEVKGYGFHSVLVLRISNQALALYNIALYFINEGYYGCLTGAS